MRAEMTVGLDLTSLENLKIFNGYETIKRERKLSLESPSSNDDNNNSDDQQGKSAKPATRQKIGRPANPVPRHKRDCHIKAEFKRRDKIQKNLDTLITLVPQLSGSSTSKESRSSILFKTTAYCQRLKSECGPIDKEMMALRQELESLGTEIQVIQDKLPQQGLKKVEPNETTPTCQMDTLYDEYIQDEQQKNWKFWIFGFFTRYLYKSYKDTVAGDISRREFTHKVTDWCNETLSLTNLRKGFYETLRKISTRTGIMNQPDKLEQEARSRPKLHCMLGHPEAPPTLVNSSPRIPTPVPSRSVTPIQRSPRITPVPTPTPTPPRTPTSSRRNSYSKRDTRKSSGNRSRSNSPNEELKQKRRQSYKREKVSSNSGSETRNISVKYPVISSATTTTMSPGNYRINQPIVYTSGAQPINTRLSTNPPIIYNANTAQPIVMQGSFIPPMGFHINSHTTSSQSQASNMNTMAKNQLSVDPTRATMKLNTDTPISFGAYNNQSLNNESGQKRSRPEVFNINYIPVNQATNVSSNNQILDDNDKLFSLLQTLVQHSPDARRTQSTPTTNPGVNTPPSLVTHTQNLPNFTRPTEVINVDMEHSFVTDKTENLPFSSASSFMPIDQSVLMNNSITILPLQQTMEESFSDTMIPDIPLLPMETSTYSSSEDSLMSFLMTTQPASFSSDMTYTTSAGSQMLCSSSSSTSLDTKVKGSSNVMTGGDEDSLFNMLAVDVTDFSQVMSFLNTEKHESS